MAGATYDIVVLSSSPPDHDAAPRELSPASPSRHRVTMPAHLHRAPSPLRSPTRTSAGASTTGSRAAPVPEGVGRGFATARSLLADIDVNDKALSAIELALESRATEAGQGGIIKAAAKPRKRVTKADTGADAEKPNPKPRGRKANRSNDAASNGTSTRTTSSYFAKNPATSDGPDAAAAAPTSDYAASLPTTKQSKPRKPRAKKAANDGTETQSTLTKGRVTKPRASTEATKKIAAKSAEVVSKHFHSRSEEDDTADRSCHEHADVRSNSGHEVAIWEVPLSPSAKSNDATRRRPSDPRAPLDIDEAVSRRREWTPPIESRQLKSPTTATLSTQKGSFTSLLSGYTCAQASLHLGPSASLAEPSEINGFTKRRRVELLNIHQGASRQVSPEKGKAPKKKPRTITGLVTGQYALQNPSEPSAVEHNLFARSSTTATEMTKIPLSDTTNTNVSRDLSRKSATAKSASKGGATKGNARKASAKAADKPKMVAEKLLSPASAMLRMSRQDILFGTSSQLALDESPTMVRDIQRALCVSEQDTELPTLAPAGSPRVALWPRLQKAEGRRALWAASSRDDDGRMLDRQVDFYMPGPDRTQDIPVLMDGNTDKSDDSFMDINDFAPPTKPPVQVVSDLPTLLPPIIHPVSAHSVVNDSSFLDIDDFSHDPPPSNQKLESSFLDIDNFAPPQHPIRPPRPASTDSPKKQRGRPPKTLSAVPPPPASAPLKTSKKAPPLHRASTVELPSTPRKGKARFTSVEEILDSEDDAALSPTPPRVRHLDDTLQFVPASTYEQISGEPSTPVYRIHESHLTFEGIRPALFPAITTLVRALPPTTNPAIPSWHEKMLMYDAIIVEDFTSWLNTHDSIRMYKKATQKQIKAWNKELKAKGAEILEVQEGQTEVLAIKKEVESFMVKKWCEDMSVCCITKEGKKGGARKGLY